MHSCRRTVQVGVDPGCAWSRARSRGGLLARRRCTRRWSCPGSGRRGTRRRSGSGAHACRSQLLSRRCGARRWGRLGCAGARYLACRSRSCAHGCRLLARRSQARSHGSCRRSACTCGRCGRRAERGRAVGVATGLGGSAIAIGTSAGLLTVDRMALVVAGPLGPPQLALARRSLARGVLDLNAKGLAHGLVGGGARGQTAELAGHLGQHPLAHLVFLARIQPLSVLALHRASQGALHRVAQIAERVLALHLTNHAIQALASPILWTVVALRIEPLVGGREQAADGRASRARGGRLDGVAVGLRTGPRAVVARPGHGAPGRPKLIHQRGKRVSLTLELLGASLGLGFGSRGTAALLRAGGGRSAGTLDLGLGTGTGPGFAGIMRGPTLFGFAGFVALNAYLRGASAGSGGGSGNGDLFAGRLSGGSGGGQVRTPHLRVQTTGECAPDLLQAFVEVLGLQFAIESLGLANCPGAEVDIERGGRDITGGGGLIGRLGGASRRRVGGARWPGSGGLRRGRRSPMARISDAVRTPQSHTSAASPQPVPTVNLLD